MAHQEIRTMPPVEKEKNISDAELKEGLNRTNIVLVNGVVEVVSSDPDEIIRYFKNREN